MSLPAQVVEFGAQWIHGQVENPVYEICVKEGLLSNEKSSFQEKFYIWRQLDGPKNGSSSPAGYPALCETLNQIDTNDRIPGSRIRSEIRDLLRSCG